ncbi:MAG TPA: ThuA domain-containing protein [Bryobacteraceae bacterium]|nr:ThuA domain-containing protein [Bryobacteraceae bacterium]
MAVSRSTAKLLIGVGAAALCAGALAWAQAPAGRGFGGRGGRGGQASTVFNAVDANKAGFITRDELKATFAKWLSEGDTARSGSVNEEQLATALSAAFPAPAAPPAGAGGGRAAAPQNQTPKPADVEKMMAALPATAPAKPKQPRKVLVLAKAAGFVHSCIPLAAKTIEALGTKTGAWSTTITYDPAQITAANLKQYDLLFLDNTTGSFLDDPNDPAATAARKQALIDFVRNGKGLAGIHAASDSYHETRNPAATAAAGAPRNPAASMLATQMIAAGDKNSDKKLSRDELNALADDWFDKLDPDKTGKVSEADFTAKFNSVMPAAANPGRGAGGPGRGAQPGPDMEVGTWPEFNQMIGGFFKWHWTFPQLITVKIDDPKSPLTAMFHGEEWDIHDETYTFGMQVWSRKNLHVLTSIDYSKMSDADKAKENWPRADHDYGLSWIRRDGKGRVFYEAHGHDEGIYALTPFLQHILAGTQYALGDLKANDAPSVK